MEKEELIPRPQSEFKRIKCNNCGNEQIIFNRASIEIKCNVCEETLVKPTGGNAEIRGEVVQTLF